MSKKKSKFNLYKHKRPTKGFLIIGDPHIWSKKPGRRRDESYLQTILGKIAWSIEYANDNDLWPICLGDLMHEAQDNDLEMIEDLIHTLEQSHRKMIVLVGNHDISETTLKKGTTLNLLNKTECIHVILKNEPFGIFEFEKDDGEKENVLLGGTPYGMEIPLTLIKWCKGRVENEHDKIKKHLGVDRCVWITHDDLAFDSHYPGAKQLHEITGVDLAINGHMHKEQKPLKKGVTSWHNPGNISRITIDLIKQEPNVWVLDGFDNYSLGGDGLDVISMKKVTIPHISGDEILSKEGKISLVEKIEGESDEESEISNFVEKIKKDEMVEKSDDAVFLKESIYDDFEAHNVPEKIRNIVIGLLDKSIGK